MALKDLRYAETEKSNQSNLSRSRHLHDPEGRQWSHQYGEICDDPRNRRCEILDADDLVAASTSDAGIPPGADWKAYEGVEKDGCEPPADDHAREEHDDLLKLAK